MEAKNTNRKNSTTPERPLSHQRILSTGSNSIISPQRVVDRRQPTPVSSEYGLTRLHTASSTGAVKTEEIERLKKNFLNLMFYCEEVRNDKEIKDSMRETQHMAHEMFATNKERQRKTAKQSKEKLLKEITKFFSQNVSSRHLGQKPLNFF